LPKDDLEDVKSLIEEKQGRIRRKEMQNLEQQRNRRYVYEVVGWIMGLLTFVGCYIYCVATYGFLWGLGFGWLPSIIAACIVRWCWPATLGLGAYFLLR
jgi:hypothetical protein